jgi:high affinity Mn2+ porin
MSPAQPRRSITHRLCTAAMCAWGILYTSTANAGPTEPDGHPDEAFDVMNFLADHQLHDLKQERWNAYGQFTWISSLKAPFSAPYTNLNGSTNSLSPNWERSFTGTVTLFLGLKLWPGAEIYEVPEVISERPLSHLTGLGGVIQNFELQKTGGTAPTLYNSRLYLRQSFDLGGDDQQKSSDPMQLGRHAKSRRLTFTVGNFSILDFFDKNSFSGDLRKQFFNMAFLTYAAYDFAADARGYAWGGIAELVWDDWGFRFGHITPPQYPNQLAIDFQLDKHYGDQIEIEHAHRLFGRDGVIRMLAYRNRETMGRFDDAVAAFRADPTMNAAHATDLLVANRADLSATCGSFNYQSGNATAPDLCWVRKPNIKTGIGINVEQSITSDVGVFFRGMISDGQTEVYSFTSTDRSISFGALSKGGLWRRPRDTFGIGYGQGWISDEHATYLGLGGVDGFIGDGKINHAAEHVFETFYSFAVASWLWTTLDYQHIWHPAYNADRGPVDVFGARMHAEF